MYKKLCLSLVLIYTSFMFPQKNNFFVRETPAQISKVKEIKRNLSNPQTYQLDIQGLKESLLNVESRNNPRATGTVISIPNADGVMESFMVFEASIMDPSLQARYPEIRSYAGQGIDVPGAVIRFSVSPLGFQSMRLAPNTPAVFIEPYTLDNRQYIAYTRENRGNLIDDFQCEVNDVISHQIDGNTMMRNADDGILRSYRLAVSATGEYTQYHGGTKALALAAINSTMTIVNGIFEIDFNVTMVLIANTDAVIYTSTSTDPYGNTTSGYNSAVQSTLSSVIGESNYDIGHLFANLQNNGNAGCIGCVCVNNQKGSGWTSYTTPDNVNFAVDYVAHEMGHQFGANHTWTFGGNEGTDAQMEPGSGSTIMGYAGITGATDLQPHSDPYFHAISIQQVTDYVKSTSCQTNINTGNAVPTVDAGLNYTIPKGTPFVLSGTASDSDFSDVLTYCWEQMDENNASTTYPSTNATTGVAFRSFNPTTDNKRYFPRLETIKTGSTSWQWEAVPNVARPLNFRLTVRDNRAGGGNNNSDDVLITVNGTAGPFVVNSPNTNVTWNAGTTQTVTWNVAGTTGNGVNAANVDIYLSTDGGDTYPIALATGVPNDGSQDVVVPNNVGTQNRIMVKGSNHIFFDISNTNFAIEGQVECNVAVPTGLNASSITDSSATVGWNAVPGASYDLQYRQVGSSTWTTVSVNGVAQNVTGLSVLTQYEAQVRSKCPDNSTSAYSSVITFTTTDVQLNYCVSSSTNTNDEYIGRVQLNTINNPSGAQTYSDFTSISTTLTKGSQYTITVTPVWTGRSFREGYAAWIDFNRDGDFDDAGEQIWSQNRTTSSPVSGSFTVPSSAVENSTRLRVSMMYNAIPVACGTFTYGEVEDYTIIIEGTGPDVTPPSTPTNLASSGTTQTSTNLSWNASTDNVGVTGYDVYQDGVLIVTVGNTNYAVNGLTASTSYAFYVIAKDAAGNQSSASNTINVTTLNPPDTTPPSAPTNLTASNTTDSTTDLTWNPSSDNVGVTSYDVYQNGSFRANVAGTFYQVTNLTPDTSYGFYVIARDAAGNTSLASNTVNVTTDVFVDTQNPTAPTLSASNTSETTTSLSWSGATDNVGVTDYDVYQNGGFIANVNGTSYQVTGLSENTTYSFFVIANDAAGNSSSASNSVNVTTLAIPTCNDGIQNGDETGVDCGGSFCPVCPPSDTILNQGYFETGLDGWVEGGNDCSRTSTSFSYEGLYSMRLRDATSTNSTMTLSDINTSPYSQVIVDFYFYINNMNNGEGLLLGYFNGSSWVTIQSYLIGSGVNNYTFYNATVTMTSAQYNFAVNSGFRFQSAANKKNEQVYVDQITITGSNSSRGDQNQLLALDYYRSNDQGIAGDILLYPNPVNNGLLNVKLSGGLDSSYQIVNMLGQVVLSGNSIVTPISVNTLKSGIYIMKVNDGEEVITERFIKQ